MLLCLTPILQNVGFKYAGVQKGNLCFCGDKFGKHGQAETTNCNTPCDFVATERCGGTNMNDIYDTGMNYMPYTPT